MSYPYGSTVFRDRAPQIPDPYRPGHTVQGAHDAGTTISILGAFVASSSSTSSSDGARSTVSTSKSLYCSPSADVKVGDRIRIGLDQVWYVNELPPADVNPFTGWQPVMEIPLSQILG